MSSSLLLGASGERYHVARTRLCRFGAVCAVLVIVLQGFQEIAYRSFIPVADSPAAKLAARALPMDMARGAAVFTAIVCMSFVFAATALERLPRAPGAALVGFANMLLFCCFELGYRSVDMLFVSRHWAQEYQASHSESVRAMLAERAAQWDAMVEALYLPLVLTAAIGATCFALSLRGERTFAARLGLIAWSLNAVRLGIRVLSFAGIDLLKGVSDAIYFPVVAVIYSLLATWLWHAASMQAPIGGAQHEPGESHLQAGALR
ncbi:hypothetical protein LZC95_38265 [Pendulispora brunnea]|uniref:Uncharacterized protein n=1 Tax=Pendulispora brunnea TaxID=2905690 RepID=A0ABZ2K4K5_9BACT